MCMSTSFGTTCALLATAGSRLNHILKRQNEPYRFTSHSWRPTASRVRALVSRWKGACTVCKPWNLSLACLTASGPEAHIECGLQVSMIGYSSVPNEVQIEEWEPEEVLKYKPPDICLLNITHGSQLKVLQTILCETP